MIYNGSTVSVAILENDIAEFTFDSAGSVNVLNQATLVECNEAVKKINAIDAIKGVLFISAKDSFIVGADITEFTEMFNLDQATLLTQVRSSTDVFNAIEDIKVPTISAISGFALGGGCELALATDFRIADETAQIGLPETSLGIIPGFGGTVRLPRVIGPDNALEWITLAKTHKATKALADGVIDALTTSEKLRTVALTMLARAINGELDWQTRRNRKLNAINYTATELENSTVVATTMIGTQAGKHYPAPMAAVQSILGGATFSREEALLLENQCLARLAHTSVAESLVGIYLNDQYIKGKAKQLAKSSSQSINKAAVLGAGIMGGGIAYQSASKGTPIVMKDINQAALDQGMAEASKILNKKLAKGKTSGKTLASTIANITPTLIDQSLESVDFVIEAVVENPNVKSVVLANTENLVSQETILTSNTSTISIDFLAQSLKRPEKFCGMHFFNPVPLMKLVEVIRGKQTSDETIAATVAYASKMGKVPVVVNDCPGFFVNRVLFPYFAGFNLLLNDGAAFADVDKVMEREFGWPMGPALLSDVVGIDTANHGSDVMANGFPTRMAKPENSAISILYNNKMYGQKTGQGFYNHTLDKRGKPKKAVEASTLTLLSSVAPCNQRFDKQEVIDRLMIPMLNETIRCLEEEIIASPQEADLALVYGVGFPPFRGGALRYLDAIGLANFVETADKYAHLGEIYQVTDKTRAMAAKGQAFYSKQAV